MFIEVEAVKWTHIQNNEINVLALLNDRRVLGNFMKTMQSQGVMNDKYLEVKNNLPEVSKQPALRLRWQYVYRELMRTFPVNYLEIV
jgi:hypothetical protein